MTITQLKRFKKQYGLTNKVIADEVGLSHQAVKMWLNRNQIPGYWAKSLKELKRQYDNTASKSHKRKN